MANILESIQQGKLSSSYGGPGSIIETIENGALKIEDYNKWKCYSNPNRPGNQNPDTWRIQNGLDLRLQNYLGVNMLVRIPNEDDGFSSYAMHKPTNPEKQKTVSAKRFPTWWFETSGNRRLRTYQNWVASNKQAPGNIEQVRFVLASLDAGWITDVPFDKIWGYVNDPGNVWVMDGAQANTQTISYHTSRSSDGLQSISIKLGGGDNGPRVTMARLERVYFVWNNDVRDNNGNLVVKRGAYKLYVRSANNLYYPTIINSIYIPTDGNQAAAADINGYNWQEYEFLSQIQQNRYMEDPNLKVLSFPNLQFPHIRKMSAICQLKMTSALVKYTRIYTPEYDENQTGIMWYDINTQRPRNMFATEIMTRPEVRRNASSYFPVVESFGEGIFFDMDVKDIEENNRLTYVHTFSHMVMKELEFICGYPVSSLREKIYFNDGVNDQFGILIYAVGGSEGSYGGLVSLFPDDINGNDAEIIKIMNNARVRARHCNNDPICKNDRGHCFACIDIPEISCCMFNKNLNRNIVNDNLK